MSGEISALIYLSILYTLAILFIIVGLIYSTKKINELIAEIKKINKDKDSIEEKESIS